jgi:hypothetical protein
MSQKHNLKPANEPAAHLEPATELETHLEASKNAKKNGSSKAQTGQEAPAFFI